MRVVLDTNVLVSAALRPKGHVAPILHLAAEGAFELFLSPFILSELERTLASRKIGFESEAVRSTLVAIKEIASIVEPAITLRLIRAKNSDNRILECAVEAEADVLVTGDMHHIRPLGSIQGIPILTPREFLDTHFPGS